MLPSKFSVVTLTVATETKIYLPEQSEKLHITVKQSLTPHVFTWVSAICNFNSFETILVKQNEVHVVTEEHYIRSTKTLQNIFSIDHPFPSLPS